MSNISAETSSISVSPDEHLGHKIYEPRNPKAIEAINSTTSFFNEIFGPNAAKFIHLMIREEKPSYPGYSQDEIDTSMEAHARILGETARTNPFSLINRVATRTASVLKMIASTKIEGQARGISEPNNMKLKELGKALVLLSNVEKELARKFPEEYLKFRKK